MMQNLSHTLCLFSALKCCFGLCVCVLQVQDYLKRFESIPDMLELDHLTVSGDVTFGKQVTLKVTSVFRALLP